MSKPVTAQFQFAEKSAKRKNIISLTPLIDVVFILLVFFMLASSFADWRSVALDTSTAAQPAPSQVTPFLVQLSAVPSGDSVRSSEQLSQAQLRLNGNEVSLQQLLTLAQQRQPADLIVSIQPLADTPVQALIALLDALDAAGVKPLHLQQDPNWQASRQQMPATHTPNSPESARQPTDAPATATQRQP